MFEVIDVVLLFLLLLWTYYTPMSSASIADSEQGFDNVSLCLESVKLNSFMKEVHII